MKRNELTMPELFLEAVGIVAAVLCIGLQIYYGVVYKANAVNIILNIVALILVYTGLTMLARYPEKVNGLSRAVCTGKIRQYTTWMVRLVKLIFVAGLLFTSVCDVMGLEINDGYSLVVVVLILIVVGICETKIIRILREKNKK